MHNVHPRLIAMSLQEIFGMQEKGIRVDCRLGRIRDGHHGSGGEHSRQEDRVGLSWMEEGFVQNGPDVLMRSMNNGYQCMLTPAQLIVRLHGHA